MIQFISEVGRSAGGGGEDLVAGNDTMGTRALRRGATDDESHATRQTAGHAQQEQSRILRWKLESSQLVPRLIKGQGTEEERMHPDGCLVRISSV